MGACRAPDQETGLPRCAVDPAFPHPPMIDTSLTAEPGEAVFDIDESQLPCEHCPGGES